MYCPEYFSTFKCIAGDCPDSCCRAGWEITIDDDTYNACISKLGDYFAERTITADDGDRIYRLNQNGNCPFLNSDGLCELYIKTGEMTEICQNYPRLYEEYDGFTEAGVSISCPEAQRLIFSANSDNYRFDGETSDDELLCELIAHREKAYDAIDSAATPEDALLEILLDAYALQEYIDTGIQTEEHFPDEEEPVDAEPVLRAACEMVLDRTDILYDCWKEALSKEIHIKQIAPEKRRAYLQYLIFRHYLKAINSEDILSQVELIALMYFLPMVLNGDYDTLCRIAAKEIEHDAENREALLDSLFDSEYLSFSDVLGVVKCFVQNE